MKCLRNTKAPVRNQHLSRKEACRPTLFQISLPHSNHTEAHNLCRHAFNNKENHITVTETARECSFESPSCSETNSNLKGWSQKGQELFLTPNCLYAMGKTRTSVNWTQAGIPRSTFWTRDHKEVWTPQHMSSGDSAAYYLPDSSTVQRPWAKDYIAKMITHFL